MRDAAPGVRQSVAKAAQVLGVARAPALRYSGGGSVSGGRRLGPVDRCLTWRSRGRPGARMQTRNEDCPGRWQQGVTDT